MEEENNDVLIGHVPDINTLQYDDRIPTADGFLVDKTELNVETDVDNHEEPTTKDPNFLFLPIKPEIDSTKDSTKIIPTDSESGRVSLELSHYKMKDAPDKLHECLLCTKTFTCESALTIHIRKHTGEKSYQCIICSKLFSTKGDLTRHIV